MNLLTELLLQHCLVLPESLMLGFAVFCGILCGSLNLDLEGIDVVLVIIQHVLDLLFIYLQIRGVYAFMEHKSGIMSEGSASTLLRTCFFLHASIDNSGLSHRL